MAIPIKPVKPSPYGTFIVGKRLNGTAAVSRIYKPGVETATNELVSDLLPYVKWGENNDLPDQVIEHIGKDEILHRSNEFNKSIHVGGGLMYYQEIKESGGVKVNFFQDAEIDDWMEENQSDFQWKKDVENYETLGNPIGELVSDSKGRVARIFFKDSQECRFAKRNPGSGEVELMYMSDEWCKSSIQESSLLKVSVLNSKFPRQDFEARFRKGNLIFRVPPVMNGRKYYEGNNTEVLMRSGTLDINHSFKLTIKSMLKNQAIVLWRATVYEVYFEFKYGKSEWERKAKDPKERQIAMDDLRDKIQEYISGEENAGKLILTGAVLDKNGKEMVGVKLEPLSNQMTSGLWVPDQQLAANSIYQGMGVDASSVGGFSNQQRSMNSGSEKQNSFTNSESTLFTERLITLMPWYMVARINGWTKKYPGFKWGVREMNQNIQQASPASQSSNPQTS